MTEINVRKFVDAPPERVFALASDFENAPRNISGITRVEVLTEGPVGVGTRFRETRVMFKREATEEMEVTQFDPPRSYALGCESHGCRYHTDLVFTPKDSGTDIEMRFQATPLTMAAKLMSAVMKPMMKSLVKCIEGDLDDIKKAAESG